MKHSVYLNSLKEIGYTESIGRGLKWIGFDNMIPQDASIFLKPNLTFPTYRKGVMTNPEAIEAAIIAIKNYTNNILIGDADSGGYNPFSMEKVYIETGIRQIAKKYDVQIVNLSKVKRKAVKFRHKNHNFSIDIPRLLTDEIDILVTMPVPKIHNMTGVSLGFKNQWGCIPEPKDRLKLHPFFKQVILEVNNAIKRKIVIMDGKYGLNVNGPMLGKAVELDWLMLSNDLGAAAQIACDLMQIPLNSIGHLQYARKLGFIPDRNMISLNCDIKPFLKEKFYLKRVWTDFPGFLAFKSPTIAWIAYFSPLSKLLHKILYLFRTPFYDYEKYSNR